MDVEGGLIATVLDDPANMAAAMERRVSVEFFADPKHKRVWEYVLQHFRTYGSGPDEAVIKGAYPSYDIEVPAQPFDYYLDELARRRSKAILFDGINQALEAREEEGPKSADLMRERMQQALEQSALETSPIRLVEFSPTTRRLITVWRSGPGALGISYGLPTLDWVTTGIHPQQFIVLTGLPKTRKSWTLLYIASTVNVADFPVIFLTFEMSNAEQVERLATLWGKIPQFVMRDKALLTDRHVKDLNRMLNVRDQLHPMYGVEDTFGHSTVSSIMALVKETGAAVVCIDGIYLMTDERTGQAGFEGHAPLQNISRDLKRMAKTLEISVIATTQTLHSKTKGGKTSLHGMGYTSAFSQDADVIVGIEVDADDDPNFTTMRVLGNRTGPQNVSFQVEWDLDTGLIEELGEDYSTTPGGITGGGGVTSTTAGTAGGGGYGEIDP